MGSEMCIRDSNNNVDNEVTFLEANDGTVWFNNDSADPEYQRVVNNTRILVEFWDFNPECSAYGNYSEGINVEILENSRSRLAIQYDLRGETDIDTYTIENGNLVLSQTSSATDHLIEDVSVSFPSNANVDDWVICSD